MSRATRVLSLFERTWLHIEPSSRQVFWTSYLTDHSNDTINLLAVVYFLASFRSNRDTIGLLISTAKKKRCPISCTYHESLGSKPPRNILENFYERINTESEAVRIVTAAFLKHIIKRVLERTRRYRIGTISKSHLGVTCFTIL